MASPNERKPRTPRTPKDEWPGCQNIEIVKIKDIDSSHSNRKGQKTRFIVKGRLKPRPMVYKNVTKIAKEGVHLKAILFDQTSTIQIVAFDGMANKHITALQEHELSQNVIYIEKFHVQELKAPFKIPDHKYQISLKEDTVIRVVSDNEETSSVFPKYIFIKGKDFETLESGMSIDVVGKICDQKGEVYQKIKVNSTELELQFSNDHKYKEGTALCIYNALFSTLESGYTLRVTRYTFVKSISEDEYIRLSQDVDVPMQNLDNDNIVPTTERESTLSNDDQLMDNLSMELNNLNVTDKNSSN